MKTPELDPLVERLLDAERARPAMPSDASRRVLERLASTLPIVPSGAPPAASSAALTGGTLGTLAMGLVAGVAIGAAGYGAIAPSATPLGAGVSQPIVITVPAPAPAASVQPTAEPAASVSAAPSASHAPVVGRDVDLAAERALLEVARTALARGEPSAALVALDQHARRFPRGRMVEERESLAVQALVSAGRRDEAKQRAARFRKRTPDSMLLPAVEEAIDDPTDSRR